MPEVSVALEIAAPIDRVWKAVTDVERYHETMPNVRFGKVVTVIDERRRHCAWSVTLKGSILEWRELEELDPDRYVIEFAQTSGDLAAFEGRWELRALSAQVSTVCLDMTFEIGIPLLEEMLNPVAERALRENCEEMLRGVEHGALAE